MDGEEFGKSIKLTDAESELSQHVKNLQDKFHTFRVIYQHDPYNPQLLKSQQELKKAKQNLMQLKKALPIKKLKTD